MTAKGPADQPYLEPWMRGTHPELDPLRRAVVHALELTREDIDRHCLGLAEYAWFARPDSLPALAFHLRHIVRSLDRLLTYADGKSLSAAQLAALATEHEAGRPAEVLDEFRDGMERALERIRHIKPGTYSAARGIGRKQLPTTVGGLLVHCAEHTQRHAGQAVTTATLLRARSNAHREHNVSE